MRRSAARRRSALNVYSLNLCGRVGVTASGGRQDNVGDGVLIINEKATRKLEARALGLFPLYEFMPMELLLFFKLQTYTKG